MSDTQTSASKEVDIRTLVPRERHALIFQLVAGLKNAGDSFVFINDHDPKPLFYQLEAEYPQQFSFTYLEAGPVAWRIQIAKRG